MTKQEQSEKIIYGSLITSTKCYNCIHFPLCFAQKSGVNLGLASENDCCYYQSKLPENSVVLSREEYEKVDKEIINKSTYDTIWKAGYNAYEKTIGECVAEARKETAEKFVNETIKRKQTLMNPYTDDESECVSTFWIYKLAKQFGVEI